MTLTLHLTLTCDLCGVIHTAPTSHNSSIAAIASKRPFPHRLIAPLQVDGLVTGWVTRRRKGKVVDICGKCAGKQP